MCQNCMPIMNVNTLWIARQKLCNFGENWDQVHFVGAHLNLGVFLVFFIRENLKIGLKV